MSIAVWNRRLRAGYRQTVLDKLSQGNWQPSHLHLFFPVQTIFSGNLKLEHLSSLELICCDYLAEEDHNFFN